MKRDQLADHAAGGTQFLAVDHRPANVAIFPSEVIERSSMSPTTTVSRPTIRSGIVWPRYLGGIIKELVDTETQTG